MSEEQEDLQSILEFRLQSAQNLDELLRQPQFSKIEGISKLKNRLASEMRFLENIKKGKTPLERKYIDTSNVTHLENIIGGIERFSDVTSVLHTFSILDPEIEETIKHTVDIVANNKKQWVKVISRSCKGICMDWLSGSSRNIFEQAQTYVEMASMFRHNFVCPEVVFEFISGVPDRMANKLVSMKVTVLGNRVPIESICQVPEDFLEMLDERETESESTEVEGDRPSHPRFNLDVSTVFVLLSNLTHPGGTEHRFDSVLLKQQAELEMKTPARQDLLEKIGDKEWIICRTAYDAVQEIMKTVGGPTEKQRKEELFSRIKVVDDVISEKTKLLKESDRINERSMKIFGSGDHYKAITATSNKHFVSSAYHQGVAYDVIIHEPRALSEQKELPL